MGSGVRLMGPTGAVVVASSGGLLAFDVPSELITGSCMITPNRTERGDLHTYMQRRPKGTNWLVKARSAVDNDSSRHVAWSERDSGGGRGYPGGLPAVGHARNRQPAKMHERTAAGRPRPGKARVDMHD